MYGDVHFENVRYYLYHFHKIIEIIFNMNLNFKYLYLNITNLYLIKYWIIVTK